MEEEKRRQVKVTMLGSGTSSGVPTIGCTCPTCLSNDPRDKRMRPSIMLTSGSNQIIIDTSSDFRRQCLHWNVSRLDAVLYTHHHFDHIAGFDDLRAFNFIGRRPVPIYLMRETLTHLQRIFDYAFEAAKRDQSSAPVVDPVVIDDRPFTIGGFPCLPIPLQHGNMRVNGYRFGPFAYCTDCNEISDVGYERLDGVTYLILDALRYRPHPTHFTLEEALEVAERIGASRTWFTHIAHDLLHEEVEASLPEGVRLGYDGLEIEFSLDNDIPDNSRAKY